MIAGIRCSFILFFSLLICFSCSIQKRHHTGGYYIQWHKHYKSTEGDKKKEKEEDTTAVVVIEDTLTEEPLLVEAEEIKRDTAIVQPAPKKHEVLEDLPRGERKFEPLGVLAAKILAVDVLVGFLNDNSNTHKQAVGYGVLFLVILGISFVLGLISMIRYLRNPRHYKFNVFGLIAMIIPLVFLIAFLAGTIAFF